MDLSYKGLEKLPTVSEKLDNFDRSNNKLITLKGSSKQNIINFQYDLIENGLVNLLNGKTQFKFTNNDNFQEGYI